MRQLKFEHPQLEALCLSPLNECGVEKLVCTFVRPTVLPYSHLFDVDACAKFVSDFIYYNPDREFGGRLNSPSRVLNEQIGNSIEMSLLLVSLLRGFGFSAFVAVGWVDLRTARLDQSNMLCPLLAKESEQGDEQESRADGGIYKLRSTDINRKNVCI